MRLSDFILICLQNASISKFFLPLSRVYRLTLPQIGSNIQARIFVHESRCMRSMLNLSFIISPRDLNYRRCKSIFWIFVAGMNERSNTLNMFEHLNLIFHICNTHIFSVSALSPCTEAYRKIEILKVFERNCHRHHVIISKLLSFVTAFEVCCRFSLRFPI